MGEQHSIRMDRNGHIAEVVLANPERLNVMALPEFFHEVRKVFRQITDDDEIRAVVLYAEGRMFTAGLDLKTAAPAFLGDGSNGSASAATRNLSLYRTIRDLQDCFSAIARCPKPVIAAVHGKCIGGGLDLITACDIRLATRDATFSVYETKIAIVADVGTLQRITAVAGKGLAREMAFTGRFIDAERALQSGLLNQVYDDREQLLAAARALADEIAANSPLAVQGTKLVLNYSDEHSTEEGLEYVAQWNSSFFQSNDVVEAVSAFMEKRPPKFEGR